MNKKGITLTELLVATILMGLIMMGVISLDYATRRSYDVSTSSADVSMRVTAAMVHIMNNAALAVGYGKYPEVGSDSGLVYEEDAGSDYVAIFIRQDVSDPGSYADDIWVRYLVNKPSPINATSHIIIFCDDVTPGASFDNFNPASCDGNSYNLMQVRDFVADDYKDSDDFYLEVTITGWDNPLAASSDPITNFEYILTSRTSPFGHTF